MLRNFSLHVEVMNFSEMLDLFNCCTNAKSVCLATGIIKSLDLLDISFIAT